MNIVLFENGWYLIDCYDVCYAGDYCRLVQTKFNKTLPGTAGTAAGSYAIAKGGVVDELSQVIALVKNPALQARLGSETCKSFLGVMSLTDGVLAGLVTIDDIIRIVEEVDV